MLTVDQVAERTGFTPYTIRKWARQYEMERKLRRRNPCGLRGIKAGSRWRFTETDLQKWMDGKTA